PGGGIIEGQAGWARQPSKETAIPRKRPRPQGAQHEQQTLAPTSNGRDGHGGQTSGRTPRSPHRTEPERERAFLVAVDSRGHNGMSTPESMRELGRLVRTAGGRVVGSTIQRREAPDRTTYIGSGKVEEIVESKEETDYNTVIFDDPLSPSQQLNLERALGVKVLDRSALILDIFASRARTREASLQVELAQHEYLLPRL